MIIESLIYMKYEIWDLCFGFSTRSSYQIMDNEINIEFQIQ